jgi:hypothetical protein
MVTALVAGIAAIVIWLLVFDMWLGQVERQYLWENARHELGGGPAVSLKAMMAEGQSAAARVATAWSVAVAGVILIVGRYAYNKGRSAGRDGLADLRLEPPRPTDGSPRGDARR